MKYSSIFKDTIGCENQDGVFSYLIDTLRATIKSWDYFVGWEKVLKNYTDFETSLRSLDILVNTLVGSTDIKKETIDFISGHPEITKIIPALLAIRDNKIKLVDDDLERTYTYNFSKSISPEDAAEFLEKTGVLKLISSGTIKSISDYFIGVEVGLDTNGRKNRSGTRMEQIVEGFVKELCEKRKIEYMVQATASKIKNKWGKNITVNKSSKQIDFAINTKNKLYLIETNYYSGGGSKLKATAGEYTEIFSQWKNDGHQFIWITDGFGWKTAKRPLRDAFDVMDYIINIDMIQKNVLDKIIE